MAQTSGIRTRHSRTCKSGDGGKCNCTPSYEAFVYSKRDKRKIRKSFPTLAAARGWRTDAGKAVKDRQLRAAMTRTLAEEVETFLAGARDGSILSKRERPYKPGVIRGYELALRLRVLPTLGGFRLADIDLSDLLALKEDLQREGVSGGTLRNTFVPLQAIYRRARQHGLVAVDPTADLPLPASGVRDRAATQAEALEVLEAFHNSVIEGLWATAFYAGLRRGELRALRVRNVDLEGGRFRDRSGAPIRTPMISVEHGWDDKEGEIAPKSAAGVRLVFVANALVPYLAPLVEGRPEDAFVFGGDEAPFDARAVARKAERAWKAVDKKRVAEAAERDEDPVLLARFTLHEARHSFSTWLDHSGVSEARADRYMGHSSGTVASRYRHLLATQYADDAATFDSYLSGAASGKIVPIAKAAV